MWRPSGFLSPRAATACLLGVLVTLPVTAAESGAHQLRIESEPPGAEVLLIGGSAGRTPLTVSERAVYPNDYPDDKAGLYGLVTLRRDGCDTAVRRVTLDDIERGLHVTLSCDPALATAQQPGADAAAGTPAQAPRLAPAGAGEPAAERRLRQLQVLQELRDDGLISAAEEERIRRALLRR